MARNFEKRFTGLNRYLEAKQREEAGCKERPPLYELSSAGDVKKWIPSIGREIQYCLQQISGGNPRGYTEAKLKHFEERIEELQKEHARFTAKVRQLDPTYQDTVPWQPRAYHRKRSHGSHVTEPQNKKKLCSPILEAELKHNTSDVISEPRTEKAHNPLGIDYSSSEEDDGS